MDRSTLRRRIGPFTVAPLGLGCMNLSHAYGTPPPQGQAERLLLTALELGIDHFDTAALYGFGANETLIGRVLSAHRSRLLLATKGGLAGVLGKRVIDGSPEAIRGNCEESLRRLRTEVIDLYYLHRWDRRVPIEESVGAMAELVRQGKVRALGLSEVSAETLLKAHAVHPIAAVQNEYSLWTRNPEIAMLETCRAIGATLVAFAPLARGFLTDTLHDVSGLAPGDLRRTMPRFSAEHYPANLKLLSGFAAVAREVGCTPGQLALAWVIAKAEHIVAIPGTTRIEHLRENLGAAALRPPQEALARIDRLINQRTVTGARYGAAAQADIDTEEF